MRLARASVAWDAGFNWPAADVYSTTDLLRGMGVVRVTLGLSRGVTRRSMGSLRWRWSSRDFLSRLVGLWRQERHRIAQDIDAARQRSGWRSAPHTGDEGTELPVSYEPKGTLL